ncbi:MAG: type IX secretion system outer membrane channel protein PorV [Bacteroidales bacterium]|nr:type IX secretion system outer membrane channel protein PorV [Bacteroidales bacterium]
MKKIAITLIVSFLILIPFSKSYAEGKDDIKDNSFNPVQTGVNSLGIAPDARGGSMGDIGAATDPDVNSQFWNPAKYAFAYSRAGVSLSYTPWLRKLVSDINLAYLAGYWKIGESDMQAISASMRYFSLGEVNINNQGGATTDIINPYEMAVDLGYSRKLSDAFSMGVVFRYIYSDLAYTKTEDYTGASAFAADISGYYTHYPVIGRSECQWSLGFDVSNIGSKISYNGGATSAFIPTNLRLGTTFLFPIDDYNRLSFSLDLNKLLVPTRPLMSQYENEDEYNDALEKYNSTSSISGIFKSFSDAPDGFSEELKEINISFGGEYNYNDRFFARAGYFNENRDKGNRKYFTMGAGFAFNVFKIDAAYVISAAQTSPLDQTLRFTLSFDMDGLRDMMGYSARKRR